MTDPRNDPNFARDVAKHLDRRRMKRKLTLWALLAGLVAAAAGYLRCGPGLGLGGGRPGDGPAAHDEPVVAHRCVLRIDAKGITVGGKPMQRADAVEACKRAGGAELVQVGDAPEGKLADLRRELTAAHVPFVLREPR
ncbi:MAG TPA: hypothetical protein VGC42_19960 [Kofleriaceae bacterium]